MQLQEKPEFQFLTGVARLLLYFGLGLALFFGASVAVFVLRGEEVEYSPMPNVTGRYYVDVHDDLTRRMQLRVSITTRQYPDQNPGLILYQSAPPGRRIAPRDKIELVVNQPEPLLVMPDLNRSTLNNARASLSRLIANDRVYALTIGVVSEIETDEAPAGAVLSQFPAPGASVSPGERVYLLVAKSPAETPVTEESIDPWIGQNVTMLGELFARRGIDYRIVKIDPPPAPEQNGVVHAIRKQNGAYQLSVYFQAPERRYRFGYEQARVELEEGECRAEVQPDSDAPLAGDVQRIFVSKRHAEDEEVDLIFFRSGAVRLSVFCGEDRVFNKVYGPERLG